MSDRLPPYKRALYFYELLGPYSHKFGSYEAYEDEKKCLAQHFLAAECGMLVEFYLDWKTRKGFWSPEQDEKRQRERRLDATFRLSVSRKLTDTFSQKFYLEDVFGPPTEDAPPTED
jgi:hypothetical protein